MADQRFPPPPPPPVYRPTSLEFINRPNPVEPHTAPHRHPSNTSPHLERAGQQSIARLLRDTSGDVVAERAAKRRKSHQNNPLSLPRPVWNEPRRPLIPPTLSGLHQPPPDAGLLPSITVVKANDTCEVKSSRHAASEKESAPSAPALEQNASRPSLDKDPHPKRAKRKHWSDEETTCLLKGVARFGIGNWTKILNCTDYEFVERAALDLKDRFRVCCPEQYKTVRKRDLDRAATRFMKAAPARTSHKTKIDLHKLGIEEPFARSARRKRRGYTAEEDEAIRKGFQKYRNSWSSLLMDDEYKVVRSRKAVDLRDRFRTLYPAEYKKSVMESLSNPMSKLTTQTSEAGSDGPTISAATKQGDARARDAEHKDAGLLRSEIDLSAVPKQPTSSWQNSGDVFLGASLEGDESEDIPVALDRGILHWPYDGVGNNAVHHEVGRSAADGSGVLDVPQRTTTLTHHHNAGSSAGGRPLPSIASMAAGGSTEDDTEDQFELPSLVSAFGPLETDAKGSGLMSLYDILS